MVLLFSFLSRRYMKYEMWFVCCNISTKKLKVLIGWYVTTRHNILFTQIAIKFVDSTRGGMVITIEFLKLWIYENHLCELRSKELYEGRSSQLYTQLLQLQKESLKKKFRLVPDSYSWALRYRCSALPIKLTSQLGAGHWIGSL